MNTYCEMKLTCTDDAVLQRHEPQPVPTPVPELPRVDLAFGVWGLGFGIWGLGSGVWGLWSGVEVLRFGVWGLKIGVWGLGFGSQEAGYLVHKKHPTPQGPQYDPRYSPTVGS